MTKNQTYAEAAELSAEFIFAQLYDNDAGIIWDSIDVGSCNVIRSALSYNSGKVIEALADMAQWNTTWTSRYASARNASKARLIFVYSG